MILRPITLGIDSVPIMFQFTRGMQLTVFLGLCSYLLNVDVVATKEETYMEYCLPGWEVSIYNVYIINQFKPLLLGGGGGNK